MISLIGKNTVSIDELLKEDGYTWRRRRQRVEPVAGDRDSSSSSSESVERSSLELVNSESSSLEWSDWFNGSSPRARNESTSSDSSDEDSESFDVEEVPYSSNVQETLKKVRNYDTPY